MSYFEDVIRSAGINETDKEKIEEFLINEDNPLEVSRAIECYFCYTKR
ncbi:MAG: hypothetical protein Q8L29_00715 [archaeon]|nr:hypothetical protein [archaeon]